MPARPNPMADLARMYRERIPTAPLSNYDKVIQSRLAPHRFTGGSSGLGFLAPVGNFLKTAVESLDPRFIASEGGRSVEHVYGDARELAKSVVTGEDTLSQSPSARAYQAAGGGFGGALAAALPYVNAATTVVPTTKLLTPAGRVALGADAAEKLAQRQIMATVPERPIGIHVSPRSGLETINPRVVGGGQSTAADALAGSSYMWDARSPETYANIFDNPQMAEMTGLGNPPPSLYVTRPRGPVSQDANVPMSSSLRVQGPQTVIGEVPFTREALQGYLQSIGVVPRSATADRLEQAYRGLSPTVQTQVANRPSQMAEEALRTAIRMANEGNRFYQEFSGMNPAAPLQELLTEPVAKKLFDQQFIAYGNAISPR